MLQLALTPQPPTVLAVAFSGVVLLIAVLPRLIPSDMNFELHIKISPSSNQVEKATTSK
jgi:hypothetical protein